ncbi:MAG: guanylate kinase [Oscillospiraceae bacterium]|jgi:guanylate kinase|nr:guanylate kinase [Oscillospiraceae bacterium]
MLSEKSGLIFVLSGPSGTGKDTVLKKLLEFNKNIGVSVSFTTRKKRFSEIEGEDYFFVTEEEFLKKVERGEMLEYATYCNNYYGTPIAPVLSKISKGLDIILKIETKGAIKMRENCKEAIHIFVTPPTIKELSKRLNSRQTETREIAEERIKIAKQELRLAKNYDYVIVNDEVTNCARKVLNIIEVEKLKTSRLNLRNESIIKEML